MSVLAWMPGNIRPARFDTIVAQYRIDERVTVGRVMYHGWRWVRIADGRVVEVLQWAEIPEGMEK